MDHKIKIKGSIMTPLVDMFQPYCYMTKKCFCVSKGYMLLHIFESMKLQVSIFLESIIFLNYILDVAEKEGSWSKVVWSILILMIGIAISTVTFSYYSQSALPQMKVKLCGKIKKDLYEKLVKVKVTYYDNQDFYGKIVWALREIDFCVDRYLGSMGVYCGSITQLILILVFCSVVNPVILLIPFIFFPLSLIIAKKESDMAVAAKMDRIKYEQKREYLNRIFYLADYAKEIRLNMDMRLKMREDFRHINRKIEQITLTYAYRILGYGCMNIICSKLLREGIIWGMLLYQALVLKNLSYTHLVISGVCCTRILAQLENMKNEWKIIEENASYIKEIRALYLLEEDDYGMGKAFAGKESSLLIRDLNFHYIEGKPVLKNISCVINSGRKVAIVGYNGAGKTTLIKLILKMYEPIAGNIEYGGINISELDTKAYRHSIGAVLQEFKIYSATLGENILMDVKKGDAQEEYKLESVLRKAGFVTTDGELSLPVTANLTTEFHQDGIDISGGERQKIVIARALFHNQNMIIMDEANSALDPLAEYNLNQELNQLARTKTVIYITHRLSTTYDADYIYMLADGEIAEEGTHADLLKENGLYAEMWKSQASLYSDAFS